MPTARPGTFRLFRLFGIDVSLHWMWLLVAVYEIQTTNRRYTSLVWNVAEYLTLFLIVLLHEFGHALACRSVGGQADHIMLWPLGGVAYVNPPPRPGALLWSIAAGPLVNVALLPITIGAYIFARNSAGAVPYDLVRYFYMVAAINAVLLAFNMLPIYPLDGGQIVRALLWFVIGRAKSLFVSSVIGLIGAAAIILFAITRQDTWLIVLAVFGVVRSLQGFKQAQAISKLLALPRHETIHCPACGNSPPAGLLWGCSCGARFDTFASGAICPQCGKDFSDTRCPHCGRKSPWSQWPGAPEAIGASPQHQ
jgi:Zn-dependent protease